MVVNKSAWPMVAVGVNPQRVLCAPVYSAVKKRRIKTAEVVEGRVAEAI